MQSRTFLGYRKCYPSFAYYHDGTAVYESYLWNVCVELSKRALTSLQVLLTDLLHLTGYQVDEKSLSSNLPPMVVFPEETKFYTKWQHTLESRGVKVRLSTEVDEVVERGSKGVKVLTRPRRPQPDNHNPNAADQDLPQTLEEYDEIVLCVLADTAQRLLGKTSRWVDRQVLGSTKWADDITVTHNVSAVNGASWH